MPLVLTVEVPDGGPSTSMEAGRLASQAGRSGREGWQCYWTAVRFLLDAKKTKKPRPQAERLVHAWCQASAGMRHRDRPATLQGWVNELLRLIREGMGAWLDDVEEPRKKQLEKARSRKRTRDVSQKAVKEFEELRAVFELGGKDIAQGISVSVFCEGWCLPAIDKHLDYWREQLAFIESRIADEGEVHRRR